MKKNYTLSISVVKFWTIFVPLFLLVMLIGGISGFVIVDKIVMPRLVGISDKGIVEIPDITGKMWRDARSSLYDIGLRLKISDREYSEDLPAGMIISQVPNVGAKVKKGRVISVVVSKGSESAKIPDVKNLTESRAKRELVKAGFNVVVVHKKFNEHCDKKLVIKSDPAGGIITSREVPIVIDISKGPKPTHAEVPNIVGDMLSEAIEKLKDSGLSVGKIKNNTDSVSPSGTVISQSVSPGKSIPLDTPVDIIVSASR